MVVISRYSLVAVAMRAGDLGSPGRSPFEAISRECDTLRLLARGHRGPVAARVRHGRPAQPISRARQSEPDNRTSEKER